MGFKDYYNEKKEELEALILSEMNGQEFDLDDDGTDDEYCAFADFDEEIDIDEEDQLSERIIRKFVIRKGKKIRKFKTDREGYRIVKDGARVKEVRMTPQELRKRKLGQRAGSRKRKATMATTKRKRVLSNRKRKTFNLK